MTKREIGERKKEHITDLKLNKETAALAKNNLINPLQIETLHIEKIANYENMHNVLLREATEIRYSKPKLCNDMTQAFIDSRWMKILKKGKEER